MGAADENGNVSSTSHINVQNPSQATAPVPRLRTAVYHELLVAYLAHAAARGFRHAHIWACPPQRSLSYIFWCHPKDQITPSRELLREWYAKMHKRATECGVSGELIG